MATVAVVEDHALVREGIVARIENDPKYTVTYAGGGIAPVWKLTPSPDLVLLDLDLSGRSVTQDDVEALLSRGSEVIIVSALGSPSVVRNMIRAGAAGFVSKRDGGDQLLDAMGAVLEGRVWMTPELAAVIVRDPDVPDFSPQERRALELYASGLKLVSVARQMGIQVSTAKEYIDRVRTKYASLGRPAPTKSHLTLNAQRDGLLDPPRVE